MNMLKSHFRGELLTLENALLRHGKRHGLKSIEVLILWNIMDFKQKPNDFVNSVEMFSFLQRRIGLKKPKILNYLKKLKSDHWVYLNSPSDAAIIRFLSEAKPSTKVGVNSCAWCKESVFILHGHHYPMPKNKGGESQIYICANCHTDFHYLQTVPTITINSKKFETTFEKHLAERILL